MILLIDRILQQLERIRRLSGQQPFRSCSTRLTRKKSRKRRLQLRSLPQLVSRLRGGYSPTRYNWLTFMSQLYQIRSLS